MTAQRQKLRAILLDVFKIEGRGSILVADIRSGSIMAGSKIRVDGIEMLVRGTDGPAGTLRRVGILVGEGHHEHLVASISHEIEGV
jgi:hypothetical protein